MIKKDFRRILCCGQYITTNYCPDCGKKSDYGNVHPEKCNCAVCQLWEQVKSHKDNCNCIECKNVVWAIEVKFAPRILNEKKVFKIT